MTPEVTLQIFWLGTSIMEHRQAYSSRLTDPTNLAQVGETIRIEEHRSNGYVHRIHVALQLAHPHPIGPITDPQTVAAMNEDLARYNQAAAQCAATAGVPFIDVWTPFTQTAYALTHHHHHAEAPTLWSDGVHLSDLGVALLTQQVEAHLRDHHVVERLLPQQHQPKPTR
ncbi:hypothetical protein [Streptomyces virginiae]|uniref:hypothetical protein n=1 Tax=Streptomyces virginiae TaxID=1961 RepID=UPI003448B44D